METVSEEMAKELAEIWDIQRAIRGGYTDRNANLIEGKLKELLEKVRSLVDKYGPETYTLTLGFPMGANASFTWRHAKKQGG
ncbi:hypothetical protein ACFLST_00535 [Chloroflexota bacterium]